MTTAFGSVWGGGDVNGCNPGITTTVTSTTALTQELLNTWFHIAVVKAGNTISIYVNGNMEGTKVVDVPFTDTHGGNLVFGHNALEGAFLDGRLDEIEIFNRALSDLEILAIYEAVSNGKCK